MATYDELLDMANRELDAMGNFRWLFRPTEGMSVVLSEEEPFLFAGIYCVFGPTKLPNEVGWEPPEGLPETRFKLKLAQQQHTTRD